MFFHSFHYSSNKGTSTYIVVGGPQLCSWLCFHLWMLGTRQADLYQRTGGDFWRVEEGHHPTTKHTSQSTMTATKSIGWYWSSWSAVDAWNILKSEYESEMYSCCYQLSDVHENSRDVIKKTVRWPFHITLQLRAWKKGRRAAEDMILGSTTLEW